MNDMQWLWIAIAVLVVLLVIGVVVARANKRRTDERHRVEARRIREQAAEEERDLRVEEARAAEAEATARRARAEADERAAEARRLEVEAERRGSRRDEVREEHERRLRRADALDPDVRTDRDGRRLDGGRTVEDDRAEWQTRHQVDAGQDESLADEVYGVGHLPHDVTAGRTSDDPGSHDETPGSFPAQGARIERHDESETAGGAAVTDERGGDERSSTGGSHAARPGVIPAQTPPDDDTTHTSGRSAQARSRTDRPMVREFRAEETEAPHHAGDRGDEHDMPS